MNLKLLKKVNEAVLLIKKSNLKKKGRNTYSNYDYYTPEQVQELVLNATNTVKIFSKFDLIRNEFGISGRMTVYDLEDEKAEPVVYEMASAIPEIKATNIAQQLGGAMTYTKRYMYQNIFEIADNNLDFDTTENTKTNDAKAKKESQAPATPPVPPTQKPENKTAKKMLSAEQFNNLLLADNQQHITRYMKTFDMTASQREVLTKLETAYNNKLKEAK